MVLKLFGFLKGGADSKGTAKTEVKPIDIKLPESGMTPDQSEAIINLIETQLKELHDTVTERVAKLEKRLDQVAAQGSGDLDVNEMAKKFTTIDNLDMKFEKFMRLYEVITNKYNPFIDDGKVVQAAQAGTPQLPLNRPGQIPDVKQEIAPVREPSPIETKPTKQDAKPAERQPIESKPAASSVSPAVSLPVSSVGSPAVSSAASPVVSSMPSPATIDSPAPQTQSPAVSVTVSPSPVVSPPVSPPSSSESPVASPVASPATSPTSPASFSGPEIRSTDAKPTGPKPEQAGSVQSAIPSSPVVIPIQSARPVTKTIEPQDAAIEVVTAPPLDVRAAFEKVKASAALPEKPIPINSLQSQAKNASIADVHPSGDVSGMKEIIIEDRVAKSQEKAVVPIPTKADEDKFLAGAERILAVQGRKGEPIVSEKVVVKEHIHAGKQDVDEEIELEARGPRSEVESIVGREIPRLERGAITDLVERLSQEKQEEFMTRMNSLLGESDQAHAFWTVDGTCVRSLLELVNALKGMSDGAFSHHVNGQKNDFANWIHDVLQNGPLSQKVSGARSKDDFLRVIEEETSFFKSFLSDDAVPA